MTLSPESISDVVAMAWCDKTSFDDIKAMTGLSEPEVIKLMRQTLKLSSFRLWRQRVSGRASKHKKKLQQTQQSMQTSLLDIQPTKIL